MKIQKLFLNFTCLFFISFFIFFGKPNGQEIKLIAVIHKWDTTNNVNHLIIKATLTNNSSDTFSYVVMSCYYPFVYKANPNILSQEGEDCEKNIPQVVIIPPHENIETLMTLSIKKGTSKLFDTSFRIGITLISVNNIVSSLNGKQILSFNIKKFIQPVNDTTYKVGSSFITVNKDGKITKFDTLVDVKFLWSNKIKFNSYFN